MARRVSAKSTRQELGAAFYTAREWARHHVTGMGLPSRVGSRKFEGKRYIQMRDGMNKDDAEALAAKYRRMGYLARVVNSAEWSDFAGWCVFVWHGKK